MLRCPLLIWGLCFAAMPLGLAPKPRLVVLLRLYVPSILRALFHFPSLLFLPVCQGGPGERGSARPLRQRGTWPVALPLHLLPLPPPAAPCCPCYPRVSCRLPLCPLLPLLPLLPPQRLDAQHVEHHREVTVVLVADARQVCGDSFFATFCLLQNKTKQFLKTKQWCWWRARARCAATPFFMGEKKKE